MKVKIAFRDQTLEIHPILQEDLDAILEVYRQCEDFLALGPLPTASMEMVLKDLETSKEEEGIFCGIFAQDGKMIGVIDYVPENYEGDPKRAYLALLMIGVPYRSQGLWQAVVEAFENEIRKDARIKTIMSGVQVNNPQAIKFWQRQGYRIVSGPILHPDQTTAFDLRKDLDEIVEV